MGMRRSRIVLFYIAVSLSVSISDASSSSASSSSSFWGSRKLLDNSSTTTTSPVVSPQQISPIPLVNNTDVKGSKNQIQSPTPTPTPSSNSSSSTNVINNNNTTGSGSGDGESNHFDICDGLPDNYKCRDLNNLVACIQTNNLIESRDLAVLVRNEGEQTLEVNVSGASFLKELQILKHHTQRIIVPRTEISTKLILNAGNGECVIHTSPTTLVSGGNYFVHLPSYDQLVTPVNGAYFLILTVLIFGGSWACCKFRRRQRGGVPYQELEMALPESSSAIDVESETAEGWDEGWDDDWDEGNAVKSPGGHHLGSISGNGLTARSNKDGWENDWDA